MLVLPHVAIGAALGTLIGEPLAVIPFAIASHFLLDSIPHWQETMAPYQPTWKTYVRIPIDLALAVAIVLLALSAQPSHTASIVVGAIFASAADLDVIVIAFPQLKRGILKNFWDWHCKIQRETESLWGVATQLTVLAISITTIVGM